VTVIATATKPIRTGEFNSKSVLNSDEYLTANGVLIYMYLRSHNRIGKVCAIVAAALVLPVLAYAGRDNGKGNGGENPGKQNGDPPVSWTPEANAAWVLVPFFGAVLLFSWRQFSRSKA
jgi:hypothetical protein